MTLFSHSSNNTSSHLRLPNQPSHSNLAPSSFSRASAVRSLKKIPSSIFNKDTYRSPPRSRPSAAIDEQPPKAGRFFASPKRNIAKESTKPKTKTRKALADILGWGSSNNSQPAAQTPPSIPYTSTKPYTTAPVAPPLPAKDDMPATLKKRPTRPLSGKSSQSALSSYRTLGVPQATPQTRARPSMGQDPFSRGDEGAEVVDVIIRHGIASSVKSSTCDGMSDKRSSVGSSKALSSRTLIGDEASVKGFQPRSITPSSTLSMPLDNHRTTQTISQQRHVSVPLAPRPPLIDVPPRTASLGRVLDARIAPPSAVPSFESDHSEAVRPALKKDKTKSKVWGIFGGGKKKAKKEKVDASPEPKPRHAFEVRPVDAPFESQASINGTIRSAATAPQQSHHAGAIPHRDTFRSVSQRTHRPTLPVLHVQQPSLDASSPLRTDKTQRMSAPLAAPVEVEESAASPSSPTLRGPWLSVAGSMPERPSADGPRREIVAAMTTKNALPKRKSLTGLFGLAFKRSIDKLRPQASRSSLRTEDGTVRLPPVSFNTGTMRSLAEEMEKADAVGVKAVSSPYRSRFGDIPAKVLPVKRSKADLRRVASATDKLSALVSVDFSPAPTDGSPSDNASLAAPPSLASLDGSPTPMRRVRSAVLTSKKSATSPLKSTISPLKLALHRSQVAHNAQSASLGKSANNIFARECDSATPVKTSMVRKGMRNIFAPPTPPQRPATFHLSPSSAARVTDANVGMGSTMGPEVLASRMFGPDVPADLRALFGDDTGVSSAPSSPVKKAMLGLPAVPPSDRTTPRRALGRALPPIAIPQRESYSFDADRISPVPPQLTLDLLDEDRTSIFSEILDSTSRNSFDFTGEYANLDRGDQRASFVEALAQVASRPELPPLPPLPLHVESGDLSHISEESEEIRCVDDDQYDDDDEMDEELEQEIATAQVQRTPRPAPFQGQPAFQAHVNQFRISPAKSIEQIIDEPIESDNERAIEPAPVEKKASQPFTFVSQTAAVDLPQGRRRQHRQDEAGASIASMSSIGSVIETGIAGDYTNYFEVNFSNHLQQMNGNHARSQSTESAISRQVSRDAMNARKHHRRNSSIVSVESIADALAAVFPGGGPPVSMHNPRRSGYISRHRRGASGTLGSGDSVSFGRSDWAAHKRASSSIDSNASSIVRLGRPGLGDRMFNLDGGVQLTSITGSPADDNASDAPTPVPVRVQQQSHARGHATQMSIDSLLNDGEVSRDSIFNSTAEMSREDSVLHSAGNRSGRDSIFNSTAEMSRSDSIFNSSSEMSRVDSIFDTSRHIPSSSIESDGFFSDVITDKDRKFMLKGLTVRPDSMASSASESSHDGRNDTFQRYGCSPMPKGQTACHEADGEDTTMTRALAASSSSARQALGASMPRPPKPRRRQAAPSHLVFKHPSIFSQPPDTPVLSSPSASEASSRLSLETRMSDVASIFSGGRARPAGMGHLRQSSSAVIKEEPSVVTLRNAARARQPRVEPRVVDWDEDDARPETMRSFNEWQREAQEEFKRSQTYTAQDEHAKDALSGFQMPITLADINDFIAKSHQTYRPLDQPAPARRQAHHRRRSSLAESRQMLSPYGLPLPKPPAPPGEYKQPKKVSLQTKYERTQKSSTGSHLTTASDDASTPVSAISTPSRPPLSAMFAQFARELPPSPPQVLANLPFAPFGFNDAAKTSSAPAPVPESPQPNSAGIERPRVNSGARRAALGWGRRRNSDGPTKVEQMSRLYEQVNGGGMENGATTPFVSMQSRSGSASAVQTLPRVITSPLVREIKEDVPPVPPMPAFSGSASSGAKAASFSKATGKAAASASSRPALLATVNGTTQKAVMLKPRGATSGSTTGLRINTSIENRSTGPQRIEVFAQSSSMIQPKASGRKIVPKRSVNQSQARSMRV